MSSKLIPANPSEVMVIRNITPNIVTLSVPFARLGRFRIGGRGTIVRLTSGALAVFSPVALTPEVKAKITEMGGTIQYIIAPDTEHHIFISEWAAAFPDAKIIGPEGLPEKRAKVTNDERIGHEAFFAVFKGGKDKRNMTITPEFDRDFAYEMVDAHPNKELVFLYRPDKVMIEADFFWNLPATEQYSRVDDSDSYKPGAIGRLFKTVQTTEGDALGAKRWMWYAISALDRKGWNESAKLIDGWDFDTVIPCHGDVMVGNGKELYEKVFDWHLKAAN